MVPFKSKINNNNKKNRRKSIEKAGRGAADQSPDRDQTLVSLH